jgi:hypothetical protein
MINEQDTASLDGIHPGRLAVEQIYGYMIRNAKCLGIITTMKGWVAKIKANYS